MNTLSHISHHLFAAAVSGQGPTPRRPAAPRPEPGWAGGMVTALPLELLPGMEQPLPAMRHLRAAVQGAGQRSADLQSAVPQNCIPPSAGPFEAAMNVSTPADCKSAIRQIANLRYFIHGHASAGI